MFCSQGQTCAGIEQEKTEETEKTEMGIKNSVHSVASSWMFCSQEQTCAGVEQEQTEETEKTEIQISVLSVASCLSLCLY